MKAGVLRHVSVGFSVEKWAASEEAGTRVLTAVAWTPHELSLVAVPADPGAIVRSKETFPMDETETQTPPALENRAGINQEIRSIAAIAAIAGLDTGFADTLIDRQATVDEARKEAFAAMANRTAEPIRTHRVEVGESHDDPHTRAAYMGEALYTRVAPGHTPSDAARQFVGYTMPDIARDILTRNGIAVTGLAPATLVTRALHTTSDFSLIMADTVNRTLRAAYEAAPAGVKRLGRATTAKDFRSKYRLQLDVASSLETVNEHGEFKRGTMAEAQETYNLVRVGKIFGISAQALINDDIGAFTDLSRRWGSLAAVYEAQTIVDLLTSGSGNGPTMSDSNTLFHADHGNLAGSGAAISETTLSAARLAMRTQTGPGGKLINVTPKHILVPAALETTAEKIVSTVQATKTADVNAFTNLDVVVDPRLDAASAARWYVTADPSQFDGLEYAHLEGAPGPQVESRNGFEVDGVEIKVRLDFGAGFVDYRSWYMNPGA